MTTPDPPVAMTVAATDSGGGAGVAADLKAFAANAAHGVFAVTAVTAQNTAEVRAVEVLPPEIVGAQIDAVLDDFEVAAVKTGLLFGVANAEVLLDRVHRIANLVVDPVLVTSTGARIVDDRSIDELYVDRLLPVSVVATPNVFEAGLLTGSTIDSVEDARRAAIELRGRGAANVVVTGLLVGDEAIDVYAGADGVTELRAPRVWTPNVHGTGCTFAATVAARLAHGEDPVDAIGHAKRFVTRGIRSAERWQLGAGHGPIDPFA